MNDDADADWFDGLSLLGLWGCNVDLFSFPGVAPGGREGLLRMLGVVGKFVLEVEATEEAVNVTGVR